MWAHRVVLVAVYFVLPFYGFFVVYEVGRCLVSVEDGGLCMVWALCP